jgi:2-iminobutanoate/2-iminopropanoate deaminase
MPHSLEKIESNQAPKAIGPYSQAILVNGSPSLIFVSGQLPLDLSTGNLITGDIRILTNRIIDNLEAILKASGSSLDKVVRVDIFLTDLKNDFGPLNEEYAKRFNSPTPPARQTVQVSALPKGSPIEISCIAVKGLK